MKIAFDAKRAFNNFTGLGNYARFVINSVNQQQADDIILYTPQIADHPEANNFKRKYGSQIVQPKGLYKRGVFKSVWRSASIYKDAVLKQADVFHGLSNELPAGISQKTKRIVTIHDLIFLRYPEFYPFIDRQIYKRKFKKACESADSIIAVSEQTKADIISFFNIVPEKITVIYQGVHDNYHIEISTNRILHLTEKYGLHQPYLLYVGSIEERKNALQLVKAFKLLKDKMQDDTELLIIGKPTDYQEQVAKEIQALSLQGHVKILNKVPFSDLPFLYKGAAATVYPSVFEGFGIPVLESLTMGTPVIAGKGSAMKEAGGEHATYADPFDVDDFSSKMELVLNDQNYVSEKMKGLSTHLQKFQQETLGKQMLAHYKTLLG